MKACIAKGMNDVRVYLVISDLARRNVWRTHRRDSQKSAIIHLEQYRDIFRGIQYRVSFGQIFC
jgi:hypothetical protein